ncbi:MAG: hypothetical protein ACI828_001049 [Flavobacteriales bacterium]|jgi:hypothetical protein
MKTIVCALAFIFLASCQETTKQRTIDYKFSDKEQSIQCEGQNNALLNEALHSFEDDIARNYDPESRRIYNAYAKFIMPGMGGKADYNKLPSEHTKKILEILIAEKIIVKGGIHSNLNYEHPAVQCIINGIEEFGLKNTINALTSTKGMNPTLFDTRMRNKGRDAEKKRYMAMYIALDAFYQNLANLEFTPATN